jgi:hypothetical protein
MVDMPNLVERQSVGHGTLSFDGETTVKEPGLSTTAEQDIS